MMRVLSQQALNMVPINLTAIIENENLIACQFHPEKSGNIGQSLLNRWLQTI